MARPNLCADKEKENQKRRTQKSAARRRKLARLLCRFPEIFLSDSRENHAAPRKPRILFVESRRETAMQSRNQGNYRNPCLTMHQPWASLLVHGIKRIEGRSWPAPIRGRLWIHAASKVPDESTIKAMEEFYREIYAVNGITEIKFPEHYPVSRLLECFAYEKGCVEVVGCVRGDELAHWEGVPEGVRLEALTDYCWLCEQPQIYEAAARGLSKVESPLPVKFLLPDPRDHFSLKPGSLLLNASESKQSELGKSSSLSAAIAGARAAAIQYSKNQNHSTSYSTRINAMNIDTSRNVETASSDLEEVSDNSTPGDGEKEFSSYNETLTRERKQRAGPSSKVQ
ncbi:hypothetical protein EUGRSUZ_H04252 [Eucalyptus grandis]|uniref:Uncharacterized protein n=2 Tax=Eucalyptus grandis TaxID=71139 RepID=A0ACC3JVM6_EUCGR|nr:hypothetical protein EUGRSUZ_H04252 [Eucalyptus grandis]